MWFWRVWMLNGVFSSSACFRPIEHSRWEASGPKHAVASWIVIYVCWLPVSCHNLFCIPQNLMLLITRIDSRFPGNVCDSIFHYEVSICTVSPPSECPRNDNWPDSNHLTICPDLSKSVLWFESEECDLSDGLDVLQTLSRHLCIARASGHSNAAATHLRRFWMFDNQSRTEQRFDRLLSGAPPSCHKNASCLKRLLGSFPLWPGSNAWISWVQTC